MAKQNQTIAGLERRLAAADKTIAVLMERVERNTDAAGNLHALLENNYTLQQEISAHIREEKELKKFNTELETKVADRTRELDKANSKLKSQNRLLKEMSVRDGLTGLFNRRHLNTTLHTEYERARRYGTDLALLIMDLDFFKEVNDNHGHDFGDFVLKEFGDRLVSLTREEDTCFRFGGEEFVILMPQTDQKGAMSAGEKIRAHFESNGFDNGQSYRIVTVSIGVTSLSHHKIQAQNDLISLADQALYQAKAEGRNQVKEFKPQERR